MQIVKQINDVDFGIIDKIDGDKAKLKKVHGDVLIVKGLIDGNSDDLMTFGVVNGEDFARIAFYKPIDEIAQMISGKEQK